MVEKIAGSGTGNEASRRNVTGVVASEEKAAEVIGELRDAGFPTSKLSVILADPDGERLKELPSPLLPTGVATGATAGGLAGGTIGWLAALGTMTMIPGSALLAFGPIVAGLGGAALGAVAGGAAGSLAGLLSHDVPLEDYEERVLRGEILIVVSVSNEEEANEVAEVFLRHATRDESDAAAAERGAS